jgi:hypothetical protein
MAIDHATFADECVLQGAFLGVHPHYLMASAALRSGIKEDTDGDRVGPYRIQQTFWDANGSAVDLEVVLEPEDIKDWRLQVLFASVTAFRAQNRLLDQHGTILSLDFNPNSTTQRHLSRRQQRSCWVLRPSRRSCQKLAIGPRLHPPIQKPPFQKRGKNSFS